MKVFYNNGHPIASIDALGLEVEAVAGVIETVSMLVRPIEPNMCEANIEPSEDQIAMSFLSIQATLRRIATDLHTIHELQVQEEKKQEERKQVPSMPEGFMLVGEEPVRMPKRKGGAEE